MFTLRVQIIVLLLFIECRRYPAFVSNYDEIAPSLETLTEELKDHDATHTIDEKRNKGPIHKDCQAESDYIQEQLSLTTKMLNDSEKVIQKQKDVSTDETVLVLGKTGTGKTSLVQFLTQNPKLQSKTVRSDTGEYIIEDGERIGTSATESFTLYPDLVNYNSTINFCDLPGFHDSRSSAHEIVSMDVMKSVTSRFKKVKILLLEKYSSLQYGFTKDDFINTLRHLNDFLVDIDRYKDNIVLIATKVPRTFFSTDDITDVVTEVTDEMHIESIMEYLNLTEASIANKITQRISKTDKEFYQNVIKLLKSFQTRDKNGKASRINVFRRPYKSGPLIKMPLLEKNKDSLIKTIMNFDFLEVKKNDFDYTLSDKAKLYLECLLRLTSDNYRNKINELSFKLNEFVTHKTHTYTSFHQVSLDLQSLHDALKHLSENLDETKNYYEFFKKVNDFISDQKIPLQINYNEQIHVLEKYEEILLKFVDTNLVFTPSSWTLPIRQAMKSAEDELHWYKSLNKYIGGLASYKIQKNKTEIYSTIFHEGSTSTNDLINLFVGIAGNTNLKQFIDAQGDTKKRWELVSITHTLLQQSNITCDANGRLIVEGFQICISEINLENLVHSHCNSITVKEVALLAIDTVFIDEDTIDIFRGVNMFILSPKWEVIGQRKIVLSGQPGPDISDDKRYVDNGVDGKPGLPGKNGGSFFGIGLQFLNDENLRIESNGGRGGRGANGAKGARGLDGKDGHERLKVGFYNQSYSFVRGVKSVDINRVLSQPITVKEPFRVTDTGYCGAGLQIFTGDGYCGSNGRPGGFGGEAGIGGLAGDQQLIELGDPSKIEMQSKNGRTGVRGRMGEIGDRGADGIGMICVQIIMTVDRKSTTSYWDCQPTNSTSPGCNTCQKLDETFELQYTTTAIEQPRPKKSPDFSYYSRVYTALLKSHTNHTIYNKIITDFREAFQRKFSYTLNDLGRLFKGDVQKKSQAI